VVLYRGQHAAPRGTKASALAIQMIFQDAFSSLNPRMRIGDIIGEAAEYHKIVPREALDDYVDQLMRRVGLDPADKRRYPHQFSGGQRQRIGIARALSVKPEFLVCDEAVSALDVSIQAQILNLFVRLREEFSLTYLFISHNLGVVRHLSDRVAIMYLGRIVEIAPTEVLYSAPHHPYTQALLEHVPRLVTHRRIYAPLKGELPSPLDPPTGCHFHPRCPFAIDRCRREAPALRQIAPSRWSACIRDG
jgi:peptide/nickel transport system ATP-binding protein